MATIKCTQCSHDADDTHKFCAKCGSKIAPAGILKKRFNFDAALILFCIVAVIYIVYKAKEQKTTAATPSNVVAQPISADKPFRSRWDYTEQKDDMSSGMVKTASIQSSNEFEFGFPYKGKQRATLHLRQHPRYGKSVILMIEKGQIICSTIECSVDVRADESAPQKFQGSESSDHSSNVVFISSYDRFLALAKKSKTIKIEAEIYQEGRRVFEFNVTGLK